MASRARLLTVAVLIAHSAKPVETGSISSQLKIDEELAGITKQRVADHGEVYTGAREVNAMLDLVAQDAERIDSRFLEPACGNGNFLSAILERKLAVVEQHYAAVEPHACGLRGTVRGAD